MLGASCGVLGGATSPRAIGLSWGGCGCFFRLLSSTRGRDLGAEARQSFHINWPVTDTGRRRVFPHRKAYTIRRRAAAEVAAARNPSVAILAIEVGVACSGLRGCGTHSSAS